MVVNLNLHSRSPSSSSLHLSSKNLSFGGVNDAARLCQTQSRVNISNLPPELIVKTFKRLDWRSIVISAGVCREWYTLIRNSTSLQFLIELGADGLLPSPSSSSTIPYHTPTQLLRALLVRRQAWQTLTWTRRIGVKMPGECQAYELVGGVFAKAMNSHPLFPPVLHNPAPVLHGNLVGGLGVGEGVAVGLGGGGGGGMLEGGAGEMGGWTAANASGNGARHMMLSILPTSGLGQDISTSRPRIRASRHDGDGRNEGEEEGAEEESNQDRVERMGSREAKTVVREDVGLALRDFAIDPTQDLIALIEQPELQIINGAEAIYTLNIHLRTISTNKPHPSARLPILTQHLDDAFNGSIIQILDDVIAVFFWVCGVPRLCIWEWVSGVVCVESQDSNAYRFVDDFSLLSPRAYMLTTRYPVGAIKICTFSPPPTPPSVPRSSRNTPTKTTTLLLPHLTPPNSYTEFTSHTAPFTARTPLGKPWTTSEDVRVHVLNIATAPIGLTAALNAGGGGVGNVGGVGVGVNIGDGVHVGAGVNVGPHGFGGAGLGPGGGGGGQPHAAAFTVVVRNRALLKYARFVPLEGRIGGDDDDGEEGDEDNVEVPWEEWGPDNSRWLPERHRYAWLRYVHGARFIRAKHGAWPSIKCRMQVLDFNVHPKRLSPPTPPTPSTTTTTKQQPQEDTPTYTSHLITTPSTIHIPSLFQSPIESRLPYSEVTRKDELPYSGFMIDEERIVGLSATAFANSDLRQVDVFTF